MKPKAKKVAKIIKEEVGNIPSGVKIIDLSPEKRGELYEEALKNFDKSSVETYGYTLDVELLFNKKGVIPRLVKVDVLASKKNEQKENTNKS